MSINDTLNILQSGKGLIAACAIIVASVIETAPIKVNPWSSLGNVFNKTLLEKIEKIEKDVEDVKVRVGEEKAVSSRYRILRFDDELLHDEKHTKEHFDQILLDIDVYERYCENNPQFKNSLAVMAISHIRDIYKKCSKENSFL